MRGRDLHVSAIDSRASGGQNGQNKELERSFIARRLIPVIDKSAHLYLRSLMRRLPFGGDNLMVQINDYETSSLDPKC